MNKIKSFQVDHRKLGVGIYVSRVDVDIVTYDLRFCKPNSGTVLDNVTMHTIEHMLATFVRNSDIKCYISVLWAVKQVFTCLYAMWFRKKKFLKR